MERNGILMAIMMHVFAGGLQLAWAGFAKVQNECGFAELICSTPLQGLLPVMRNEPDISIGFAIALVQTVLGIIWSVLSFNYAMFVGDNALTYGLGITFRLALGLTALQLATGFIQSIISAIRG